MVLNNVEIRSYCNHDLYDFKEMFCTYFREDFNIEIEDKRVEEICSQISESLISGIISLDMLLLDGKIDGFIYYQIDTPRSDWCEREGWGFIREIYVNRSLRGNGLGVKLVAHSEEILYASGVEHIYLTSDEAGTFWSSCGYMKIGNVSKINNDPIYEK